MIDPSKISDELKEKAKSCTSAEELVALASANGIELTDEDLTAIAAGEGCYRHTTDWKGDCEVDNCVGYSCCKSSVSSVSRKGGKGGALGLM